MLGAAIRIMVCVLAIAAAIGTTTAQAQVSLDSLDPVGDAGGAPDINWVTASVFAVDDSRVTVRVGTWLDHSDLAADEEAHWTLDIRDGGSATGADLLFQFWGHDFAPDTWQIYKWQDTDWVPIEVNNSALATYADGRVYWQLNLVYGPSTNRRPGLLRAYTGKGEAIDRAPDSGRITVEMTPHGNPDPLEGCYYDGGCVSPASSVDTGEHHNGDPVGRGNTPSATCSRARSALSAIDSKIAGARAALRRAHSARARRRARARLRSLRPQRVTQQALVNTKCPP
jgi:hypothetical protein